MDQQIEMAELIVDILNDPEAHVKDARLLLGRRRDMLPQLDDGVVERMKFYASIHSIAPPIPLLRDLLVLLAAIHDFASLDIGRRDASVSPGREARAKSVVERCKLAIASVQSLVQHERGS